MAHIGIRARYGERKKWHDDVMLTHQIIYQSTIATLLQKLFIRSKQYSTYSGLM